MAKICLKNIKYVYSSKNKKDTEALKGIDLVFSDGCAGALLGPSGCGKTTLLNLISGLLKPTEGEIFFNDTNVTHLPPEERNIAQIFQFPVVYDSIDVYGNLAFPLKNRKLFGNEIKERVTEIAKIIGLEKFLHENPRKLNAGQRQLLALGRGLVRKDTAIILLDEPMTQLDLHQKWFLRKELKKIQQRLKVTMIYVTHDQHEALSFAEKIVVMKDGNVVQEGTPETLYDYPKTPFVGWFIGTPGMNFFNFFLKDNILDFKDFKINMPQNIKEILKGRSGMFQLGIRPEYVRYSLEETKEGYFLAKLTSIENMGYFKILTFKLGDTIIKAKVLREIEINEGQETWISITDDEKNLRIYENGVLISN